MSAFITGTCVHGAGILLGCKGQPQELTALVDSDDIHCLMIGASALGKPPFFLYPNLEYACASGMSWLALDSKGDLARNYGTIAKNCYGYNVSVIDLRNPTRSDGNNLLTLVNRYMDIAKKIPRTWRLEPRRRSTPQKLMDGLTGTSALVEGKKPRKHQLDAISKAYTHYIIDGNDRGKLIMACGTGKTYTSLLITEQLLGGKGLVLFMVPSIALLGQSLNAWSADAKKPIKAVCICSDSKASRKIQNKYDDMDDSVVDLAVPASTSPQSISNT